MVKKQMKVALMEYESKLEQNLLRNPEKFWQNIKNKKAETSASDELTFKSQILNNKNDIVNAFANHFASVYSKQTNDQITVSTTNSGNEIRLYKITAADVREAIKKPQAEKVPRSR